MQNIVQEAREFQDEVRKHEDISTLLGQLFNQAKDLKHFIKERLGPYTVPGVIQAPSPVDAEKMPVESEIRNVISLIASTLTEADNLIKKADL